MAAAIGTGVSLYNGASRRHPHTCDVVELIEGARERICAADTNAYWTNVVYTNWVSTWSNDPSGLTYTNLVSTWSNGPDGPLCTTSTSAAPYLKWSGTNAAIYTQAVLHSFGNALSQDFTWETTFREDVGRYVWGGWDSLTVTNSGGLHGGVDGTYQWYGRRGDAVAYTNDVSHTNFVTVLVDYGPEHGWAFLTSWCDTNNADWPWDDPLVPIYSTHHTNESAFGTNGLWGGGLPRITPNGNLNTNHIREAPAIVFHPLKQAIGKTVPRSVLVSLDATIRSLVPSFVDDALMSNGTFDAYFTANTNATSLPMLTVTGLWARLGIGDGTNQFTATPAVPIPANTSWIYSFTGVVDYTEAMTAVCYTAQEYHVINVATAWQGGTVAYSNATPLITAATNMPATFGDYPIQIHSNAFLERARVLNALRYTAVDMVWHANVPSNRLYSIVAIPAEETNAAAAAISGSRDSYAAQTNCTFATEDDAPFQRTSSQYGYIDYEFYPFFGARTDSRTARASISFASTSVLSRVVQYYVTIGVAELTQDLNLYGLTATNVIREYSESIPLTNRPFCIDVQTNQTGTQVLSRVIGSLDIPSPHAGEADPDGNHRSQAGWQAASVKALVKWTFQNCTNSP